MTDLPVTELPSDLPPTDPAPPNPAPPNPALRRRDLMLGAGALAALGAAVAARPAAAKPKDPPPLVGERSAQGSPITSTIATPRRNGYVYRTLSMWDFLPESAEANLVYTDRGMYVSAGSSQLWAAVDAPAGALLRDIEFYAFNNSGRNVSCLVWLWSASGGFSAYLTVVNVPSSGRMAAVRAEIPSASSGPFPTGTKLCTWFNTGNDGLVRINGARLGFSQGAAELGFLSGPERVYDSRAVSTFAANETRTITLPAAIVPRGCVGVAANLTVTGATGTGWLKAWPAHAAEPAASALNFTANVPIANGLALGISAGGQIKLKVSKAAHVIVDVSAIYG